MASVCEPCEGSTLLPTGRLFRPPRGAITPIYTAEMIPCPKIPDWGGFLDRPSLASPAHNILQGLREAPVLVIGAAGSIGSALAARIAALDPPRLVLLDASENDLHSLQRQWAGAGLTVPTEFRLGSAGDRALLEEIFARRSPGLVFHAGAFKHVPLLEEQPLAAMENNIFGTLSLMEAAAGARVVLLSTDKAVAPASVMGATKRVAEQIVLSAGGTALRLGNVLASRGSVVEVFAGQIAAGGPLCLADPAASRYFITLEEAVSLLLSAALELEPPVLLAPALPAAHRIADLARFMIRELAGGLPISVRQTGLRAGDKASEQFWSPPETPQAAPAGDLIAITSPMPARDRLRSVLARLRSALDARDLAAALDHLQTLVPDYTPSETLRALLAGGPSRVPA